MLNRVCDEIDPQMERANVVRLALKREQVCGVREELSRRTAVRPEGRQRSNRAGLERARPCGQRSLVRGVDGRKRCDVGALGMGPAGCVGNAWTTQQRTHKSHARSPAELC